METLKLLNIKPVLIFIILNSCLSTISYAQIPDTANSYELIFWDEFNGDSIDTINWASNAHYGNSKYIINCDEDTIWTWNCHVNNFENFEFTDSSVLFVSKKEPPPGYYDSRLDTFFMYSAARLFCKKQFRYGYFEIRIKIPEPPPPATHKGISAAFWMFEANRNMNVAWSEIDAYEINCLNNELTTNIHFGDPIQDSLGKVPQDPGNHGLLNFQNNFKILSFDWTADSIVFFVDGIRIRGTAFKADTLIPMPIYIDGWTGYNQFCDSVDSVNTVFPFKVKVDYVRVYQRKLDLETNKSYCGNINSHDFSLYKSITVDGAICTDLLTNKSSFPMEATDYILLNQGFTASTTSNLYLNIMKSLYMQNFSNEIHQGKDFVNPPKSWYSRIKFHSF